jgi:hypothetical protein
LAAQNYIVISIVRQISVGGDRADPMNLFNYIGKIGNAVTALEPGISEADVQSLIGSGLGLMRGDDDPTIGHAKVMSRKTFTASCNQVMSAESTATHCEFAPRS